MGIRTINGERFSQRVKEEARFAGLLSLIGVGVLLGLLDRAMENAGQTFKRWSGRGRISH